LCLRHVHAGAQSQACVRCQDAVLPQCFKTLPGTAAMMGKAGAFVKRERLAAQRGG